MKLNWNSVLIYGGAALSALLIVFFVSSVPLLAFRAQDEMLFNSSHERQKIDSRLSPEVEEIYLVRAIHNYYSDYNSYGYFSRQDQLRTLDRTVAQELLDGQMELLKENGVFDGELFAQLQAELPTPEAFTQWEGLLPIDTSTGRFAVDSWRKLKEQGEELIWYPAINAAVDERGITEVQRLYSSAPAEEGGEAMAGGLMLALEPKTQKALTIAFETEMTSKSEQQNREIAENYVRYLGLDVLDDWHWEGEGATAIYRSQKARLRVLMPGQEYGVYLAIAPWDAPSPTMELQTEKIPSSNGMN